MVGSLKVLRFSASGNSVWAQVIHGALKERRYHVDDIKVYVCREGEGDVEDVSYVRTFLKWGSMHEGELAVEGSGTAMAL